MSRKDKDPTDKFTGLADAYASFRPTYPQEAIDYLFEQGGLAPGRATVVDVGCGTGIFSRLISQRGVEVIGIEPNRDMIDKAQLEQNDTIDDTIHVDYRHGTAEATELEDGCAEAVVSAQAFHWFKPELALKEFHRVLRPGGFCALVWNERNQADELTREYGALLRRYSEDASIEVQRGVSGKALLVSELFETIGVKEFHNSQTLNEAGIVGRAFSTSYAPVSESGRSALESGLRKLHSSYATGGKVTMRYITTVYLARKSAT